MDKKKLLEYAQYGCTQKMITYKEFAEKTSSALKVESAFAIYEQIEEDCREINKMISELKE